MINMEDPITEKQAAYIKRIEEVLCIKFKGKDRQDACDFISKHIDAYRYELLYEEMEFMAIYPKFS